MSFLPVLTVRVIQAFWLIVIGLLLSSCSSSTKYDARSGSMAGSKNSGPFEKRSSQCNPYYKVVSGDALGHIAEQCQVSMQALAKANELLPPYVIYVNQELAMPIVVGESGPSQRSQRRNTTKVNPSTTLKAANPSVRTLNKVALQVKPEALRWRWPMHTKLEYRYIRDSEGLSVLEIYGLPGQDVNTVAPGKVVYAGNGIINYGWMVVIKHDDDYMSIYAHNSALLVKEGDRVESGQKIAEMGATGNTTQPKLYLEARYEGRKIDINKVLKK